MEFLWTISTFYMQVDQRDKVELLRKLAYVEDFRSLAFSTAYLILVVLKKNYNTGVLRPCRWPVDVNVKYRKVILERFKDHQLTLLLATDLVARGIDIEHLDV